MPTLILTGCSSGLGFRVLQQLLNRFIAPSPSSSPAPTPSSRWRLIAGVRSPQPSPDQVKLCHLADSFPDEVEVLWLPLDLADGSGASVKEFVRLVTEQHEVEKVEGILLNAASWGSGQAKTVKVARDLTGGAAEGEYVEEALVNHFAQQYLVRLLLPLLKSAAGPSSRAAVRPRIVYTSSNLHESVSSLDHLPSILFPTSSASAKTRYAASKVAALVGAQSLIEEFASSSPSEEIDVVAVSPGFVPTTKLSRSSGWLGQMFMRYVMSWAPFAVTEEEGAQRILRALPLPSSPSPSSPSSSPTQSDSLTSLLSSSRSAVHPHLVYLSGSSNSPLEEVVKPVGGAVGRLLADVEEGNEEAKGQWGEAKRRWGVVA
ncbi:hypothetical protein JCM11251_007980 [Rhodosporidiobolus azoricus]